MSVQTEIDRISGNVSAALSAIAEKGVTVPDGSTSDALAGLIASIQEGEGGTDNFIAGSFTITKILEPGEYIYIDITIPNPTFPLMYAVFEDTRDINHLDTSHAYNRLRSIIATRIDIERYMRFYVSCTYNKPGSYTANNTNNLVSHNNGDYSNTGGVHGSMDISLNELKIRFNPISTGAPYLQGRTYYYILYWE